MGDWSYLSSLLDEVQSRSTMVGKIWMSVLFLFRIFVLGAAADQVWKDEEKEFHCDSYEPGCELACYNWMFPISFVHYWVLQTIFVSTPTLVYLGHALHIIHKEERLKDRGVLKSKFTDGRGKIRIKGILFCTYMTQLVFKILLEVGFAVGQYYIFGTLSMNWDFHCQGIPPCAVPSGAVCYISRPTEKTVFIVFMLGVSGVSVLLTIVEVIYLLRNRRRHARKRLLSLKQGTIRHHQQEPFGAAWGPSLAWKPTSPGYGDITVLPVQGQDWDGHGKEKDT